jgi:hypothetical protein
MLDWTDWTKGISFSNGEVRTNKKKNQLESANFLNYTPPMVSL